MDARRVRRRWPEPGDPCLQRRPAARTHRILHRGGQGGRGGRLDGVLLSTRPLLNRDYARFWLSQVLTSVASKSMTMVFPLLATISFAATPFEVGVVTAAQYVPVLVVTLFVGMWLDRRPRRPTLLFTDIAGGMVLLVVPVLSGLDEFHLGMLYAVAFGFGSLVAIAEVCAQAYLPSLVGESDLLAAIGRLEAVFTLVVVAAPGLGGLLMNWLGGPGVVLMGAVFYLIAALVLMTVTRREPPVPAPPTEERVLSKIAAGARFLLTVPVLRTLIGQAALFNFFEQAMLTLYTIYAASVVGVTPALLGLTVTLGAVGSMLGAVAAEQAERRWGLKRVVVASMAIASVAPVLIPLATRPTALTVTIWSVSFVRLQHLHPPKAHPGAAARPGRGDHPPGRLRAAERRHTARGRPRLAVRRAHGPMDRGDPPHGGLPALRQVDGPHPPAGTAARAATGSPGRQTGRPLTSKTGKTAAICSKRSSGASGGTGTCGRAPGAARTYCFRTGARSPAGSS
ncbi:MFS transporter, partial [Streptomyces tendae]